MRLVMALAVLLLGHPAQSQTKQPTMGTYQQIISKKLRDPDAARFQDMKIVSREGSSTRVCGQVNAQNAYGGYIGFQWFYADVFILPTGSTAVVALSEAVGASHVLSVCK